MLDHYTKFLLSEFEVTHRTNMMEGIKAPPNRPLVLRGSLRDGFSFESLRDGDPWDAQVVKDQIRSRIKTVQKPSKSLYAE